MYWPVAERDTTLDFITSVDGKSIPLFCAYLAIVPYYYFMWLMRESWRNQSYFVLAELLAGRRHSTWAGNQQCKGWIYRWFPVSLLRYSTKGKEFAWVDNASSSSGVWPSALLRQTSPASFDPGQVNHVRRSDLIKGLHSFDKGTQTTVSTLPQHSESNIHLTFL